MIAGGPQSIFLGRARELVDGGTVSPGIQYSISVTDCETFEGAYGVGPPGKAMTPRTVHSLYCATKPIVAWAFLVAAAEADLPRTAALSDWSDRLPDWCHSASDLTIQSLLDHTAGLTTPGTLDALLTPPSRRSEMLSRHRRVEGLGYSEYLSWALLEAIMVSVLHIENPSEYIEHLLQGRGIRGLWFNVSREVFDVVRPDIGVTYALRDGGRAVPWLHDRTFQFLQQEIGIPLGGFGTMTSIRSFYAKVVPTIDFTHSLVVNDFDVKLGRRCSYVDGFLTHLGQQHFGQMISPLAVGHVGWMRTFAFYDPENELSCAVALNGAPAKEDDLNSARAYLIDGLYKDYGLGQLELIRDVDSN